MSDSLMHKFLEAQSKLSKIRIGSHEYEVSPLLNQYMGRQQCSPSGDPTSTRNCLRMRDVDGGSQKVLI